MSQITNFIKSSGPGSGTVTSISQGTGITLTPNPITTTGSVALTIPVVIANGGTNATSFTNTDGVVYFDGTRLVDTAVGTSGYVLTSNGAGMAPTFQANSASGAIETITGDSGGPQSPLAGNFDFTGGLSGLTFSGSANTQLLTGTLVVAYGGTGATSFTAHSLLVGEGTSAVVALGAATNGQIPIGSTGADPVLSTITAGTNIIITNGAGSITIAADTQSASFNYTGIVFAQSPYSALSTDYYIGADVTLGAITVKLPTAPATGRAFVVKDKSGLAATNNITVTTVSGAINIDGATSFVMNTNYEAISLIFNGLAYEVY